MIPDPDGWSVLQTLSNQLETRHIPVIVCTVLGTKELAFSLGAAAFLEKPVTEEALLGALEALGKVEDTGG
jgi:CheY-like chemotaxis protein